MIKIGAVLIQANHRRAEAPQGIASIGTAPEVDIRFDPAKYRQVLPLHVCLKRTKKGLQVCRLTPGAEVFKNGKLMADEGIVSEPCVLQIGAQGPVMHLEFERVGKDETVADGDPVTRWGKIRNWFNFVRTEVGKVIIKITVEELYHHSHLFKLLNHP